MERRSRRSVQTPKFTFPILIFLSLTYQTLTFSSPLLLSPFHLLSLSSDQAISRTHRMGQTKPVTVYRLLMRDSLEEWMDKELHTIKERDAATILGHKAHKVVVLHRRSGIKGQEAHESGRKEEMQEIQFQKGDRPGLVPVSYPLLFFFFFSDFVFASVGCRSRLFATFCALSNEYTNKVEKTKKENLYFC